MVEEEHNNPKNSSPDHLFVFDAGAKGYKLYLQNLKSGTSSGISSVFGTAEDLFAKPLEIQAPPVFDTRDSQPEGSDAFQWRAIYFAHAIRFLSREYLFRHFHRCRSGEFGATVQQSARVKLAPEAANTAIKQLACAHIYMTDLEQNQVKTDTARWLDEFFAGCFAIIDKICEGPNSQELLKNVYNATSTEKIAQRASTAVGATLKFGDIGNSDWDVFRIDLLGMGRLRYEIFEKSLTTPMEQLREELLAM
jgi:hypothetical protein